MAWSELAWAVASLLAVFAVAGGVPAYVLGLRGLWFAAAVPAFGLTVIGGAAVLAGLAGVPWSILPVALVAVAIAAAIVLVRLLMRRGERAWPSPAVPEKGARNAAWLVAALLIAVVPLVIHFIQAVGAPDAISQSFDNIFHLNGVRFVLDTANASSLHLGQMTSPGGGVPFYPAVWHGVAALVVQLTGVSIPVATNALALVAAAMIWPTSVMLLTRVLLGASPVVAVATGLLAAAIPAFPALLYDYGVLYPLLLGLSVLPFSIAVTVRLLGVITPATTPERAWWLVVLVGAVPGLALAHPGAFVALLALTVPSVLWLVVSRVRRMRGRTRAAALLAFAAYLVVGAVAVEVLRPPREARGWPIAMPMLDALTSIATVSLWYPIAAVVVACAVAAGVIWAIVDRKAPAVIALGMYLIGAWLYFAVAALPLLRLRDAFTGSWYNNLPRLAAILAIAMVPIGAYGIHRVASVLGGWLNTRSTAWRERRAVRAVAGAVVVVALIALTQIGAPSQAAYAADLFYRDAVPSPLLDRDERALLDRLPDEVPPDAVVAGDPLTGAALAYALADRQVLFPHALTEITPDMDQIRRALVSGELDGAVCEALQRRQVRFVLDFGTYGVHGTVEGYPGLATSPDVRLVDRQGDARLYAITTCGFS